MTEIKKHTFPLISVALCTYNGEKYLVEQLNSLISQSYPNVEIIAVDDCSTDSTLDILNSYSDKYEYFHVYRNERNMGLSKNFEKAILLCKGEFFAVSDQDDIWHTDKLSVLYECIGDNLIAYANSTMINEKGESINRNSMDNRIPYSGNDPRVISLINFIWGHNILFKKELVQLTFPLPHNCDYDWFIGISALNYGKIIYADKTLVYHRRHGENATLNMYKNRKEYIENLKNWFTGILTIKDLKHQDFFAQLLKLFTNNSFAGQCKLFLFLWKKRKILFYVSSKSIYSKLNEMRKLAFHSI